MSPTTAAAVATIPEGSPFLRWSFVVLSLLIAGMFAAGVRWAALRSHLAHAVASRQALGAASGAVAWLALTGLAASRGFLHFEAPPTMMVALVLTLATGIALSASRLGRRLAVALPVAALVGFQGFRVAVELLMHRAYTEGLMPVQMSYSGRNFDIITGVTAIALGAWLAIGRTSPRLVFAWNTLGLALLVNIVVIALLSAPVPFRVFMNEPANVWVTQAPWIWLPTVMVLAAVIGHILVYRRLWIESRQALRVPRALGILAVIAAVSVAACADQPTEPVEDPVGVVTGNVVLLGSDTIPDHSGTAIMLYKTAQDLEVGRFAYATGLNPAPVVPRRFLFTFTSVEPGEYYAAACFVFGCGEYRDRLTGELLTVSVSANEITNLMFGL